MNSRADAWRHIGPTMPAIGRRAFIGAAAAAAAGCMVLQPGTPSPRGRPRPSPGQLAWQRDELAMFVHFGVNTFTDREWGDGREDPAIFAPKALDARQWARTARSAGFRSMILTAKHHDGFCLWPSATTTHTVAASPWRGGRGDVVREFVDACRAEGLRPGLYLSPWDRNAPVYGDSERYNDFYCAQLTELLSRYGSLAELWFDGANGEGPNGRRQRYDWPRFFALVRRLQPRSVIFSDAGPDVRWCGNERGEAGEPNWSTVMPDVVPHPGADGPGVIAELQHGDPSGTVWRPAEVDVSIRPGWFFHEAENERVRTVENLIDLWFSSVGRNAKLLLNVPPARDGLIHRVDAQRLRSFRDRLLELTAIDFAEGVHGEWRRTGERSAELELALGRPSPVRVIRLEERIERGQRVAQHRVLAFDDGTWLTLARGTTIGYARLHRIEPTRANRFRIVIDHAVDTPEPLGVRLF